MLTELQFKAARLSAARSRSARTCYDLARLHSLARAGGDLITLMWPLKAARCNGELPRASVECRFAFMLTNSWTLSASPR